jgi:hypothetical protein
MFVKGILRLAPSLLHLSRRVRPLKVLVLTSLAFSLTVRALSNSTVKFVSLSDIMGDQTSKMMESGDVVKEKPKPQVSRCVDDDIVWRTVSEILSTHT